MWIDRLVLVTEAIDIFHPKAVLIILYFVPIMAKEAFMEGVIMRVA